MGNDKSTDHVNKTMDSDVSEKTAVVTADELKSKLSVNDKTAYIQADPFIANPYSLLGRVIEVRRKDGKCPNNLNDPNAQLEFSPLPISGVKIDEASKIKEPVLRSSIVVNDSLCASVSFLSYLSGQLDTSSFFSLMVFDQAVGLIDVQHEGWATGLKQWKIDNEAIINDPEVCFIYGIIGMVQKNIVRKKFVKFKAGVKGGAYGLNVNGELATSTEEYSLDVIFGLTPVIIKRPDPNMDFKKMVALTPTHSDLEIFSTLSGSTMHNTFSITQKNS